MSSRNRTVPSPGVAKYELQFGFGYQFSDGSLEVLRRSSTKSSNRVVVAILGDLLSSIFVPSLAKGSLFNAGMVDSPDSNRSTRRITQDTMLVRLESIAQEHLLNPDNASSTVVLVRGYYASIRAAS